MPLISIIIPTYNQAHYLEDCLQSVLDQTFSDWECLIIDDGSTDHTKETAVKWVRKDNRFRYLFKNNGGVASARNFGIANSDGKWILPLDGDDKLGNKYLELASKLFNLGYNLISSNVEHFGSHSKLRNSEPFVLHELLFSAPFCISSFFLKKDWESVGGFDENLLHGFEDTEFWIHLWSKNNLKYINLDYTGLYYRIQEKSRSADLLRSDQKIHLSWEYIIKKHVHLYAMNIQKISEVYYKNKQYKKAFSLLKKSRILGFLNKIGLLRWIHKYDL